MKKNSPTIKNRKPVVYIFLSLFIFSCALIIAESSMPGGVSSAQSGPITNFFASIVNFFEPKEEAKIIEPTGIELTYDSSYLGEKDGKPQLACGTTSLLTYTLSFPEKRGVDIYDSKFIVSKENESDGYSLTVTTSKQSESVLGHIRITAEEIGDYSLDIECGGEIKSTLDFSIVDRPAPESYVVNNIPTSVKCGESYQLDVRLIDTREQGRNDKYLRRVFDQNKIETRSNSSNVSIDPSGMIDCYEVGNYEIKYGKYTFPLEVTSNDELVEADSSTVFNIKASENTIHLRDYDFSEEGDYSFEEADPTEFYGAIISVDFGGKIPTNRDVIFESEDEMIARIVKVQKDENGNPMAFVQGYRKSGEVKINVLPRDRNIAPKSITLKSEEAILEELNLSVKDLTEVEAGQRLEIMVSNPFPSNASNLSLYASEYDEEIVSITGQNTNVISVSFLKEGKLDLTITSVANPELKKDISFNIKARGAINESNIDDVHSFIRKSLGHFTLFLVTSIFGSLFFYFFFYKEKLLLSLGISSGVGAIVAMASELIQHFIPSRFGSWGDVGIDVLGYIIGGSIMLGIFYLIKFIKNKNNQSE